MINKETPDKIAEIIRDTWPGIYRKPSNKKPKIEDGKSSDVNTKI